MANSKQATKRWKQSVKRRTVNKNKISQFKTVRKSFEAEPTMDSLKLLQKNVDQTKAKGLISKKRASRIISRARKNLSI
ncbi:30S ribosomal protein S20 [Gammaproteobacteria bacterium]|nr:30S ribosomal protein S20 [Gammaproteobacteria bacterium]